MNNPHIDMMTSPGAARLVAMIRAYWLGRGFAPNVYAERRDTFDRPAGPGEGTVVIRSDMLNACPTLAHRVAS